MPVQTFNPSALSQSETNWAVARRLVDTFAPHAQAAPNMTVAVDAGALLQGTTLTEVNPQTVGPFTTPTSGIRIDRVVVDRTIGTASIVVGTAGSGTPPAIPANKLPVARVILDNTTVAITNERIYDERVLADVSSISPPAWGIFSLSGDQTTNLSVNSPVRFATTMGGNLAIANYTITLPANKTFVLRAATNAVGTGSGGYLNTQWYNVTAGAYTGIVSSSTVVTYSGTINVAIQPTALAVITTTVATDVQLRIMDQQQLASISGTQSYAEVIERQ